MQTTARDLKGVTAIEFSHEATIRERNASGVNPEAALCRQIAEWIDENPSAAILSVSFDNSHMPTAAMNESDPQKRVLRMIFGDDPWVTTATVFYEPSP